MVKKLVPLMILLAVIMFIPVPDGWAVLPSSILPPEVPEDNPSTPEKVALGKKLYFDKRLSIDNTVSCATCHDQVKGFADGKKVSEGIRGLKGTRNAPTVLNAAFYELQFWDGRAITLEDQAKLPIINPVEMGMPSFKDVEEKIRNIPEYKDEFMKVFGTDNLTMDHIAKAIAAFERTIISVKSPFDRFIAGDNNAISQAAQAGWKLFNGKARCNNCHGYVEVYPFFTDNKFHNIGVAMNETAFETLAREAQKPDADSEKLAFKAGVAELGRFIVTHEPKDIGAFKSSGLRNIALTAPYMHDGSEATLESVIDFYNKGGVPNPNLDGGIVPLGLTDEEKSQLVEFLKSLTSEDLDQLMQ
ncbi:MAG: cytochrome-c peroxidase [Candidatus Schekmanbacteria bacterium]|nr:cytochrome-c peroxidase [Candidatus Schekmanbacteria bacterium]